ncbi:MAG TPA: amidohydrolase family protein [Acidimicrobiales bacterium]|nr:amidohydrolase family protein [Acidimicrobiales bacterium]
MHPPASSTCVVDVHTHFMPLGLPDFAEQHGDPRWPRLVASGSGGGEIRRGPKVFRTVERSCFDIDERLEQMDRFGVDTQVISPVPVTLTYWADGGLADEYARRQNDALADAASRSGGRLLAFAGVALQDPELAIRELERAVTQLDMRGVEIGASVGSDELDAVGLRDFFAAASDLGARLLVHPLEGGAAIGRPGSVLTAFGVGMLTDTTFAATALVFGGVLEELPDLKIVLSHGGGSFCSCFPRLRFRHLLDHPEPELEAAAVDARTRGLFVDSIVFDPFMLGVLRQRFGADHVLLGSDYPFKSWEPPGPDDIFARAVDQRVLEPDDRDQMRGPNALAFLGLAPTER